MNRKLSYIIAGSALLIVTGIIIYAWSKGIPLRDLPATLWICIALAILVTLQAGGKKGNGRRR